MKSLFCSLFLLFSYVATAQFADLMQNKNVAWVAESTVDMRFDMLTESQMKAVYDQSKYDIEAGVKMLKLQDNKEVDADEGFGVFANTLLNAAKNKQITVYSDNLCTQVVDALSVMSRIDTIVTIDPTTYETKYRIVMNAMNSDDVTVFRAHQMLYYMPKSGTWGVRTLAIAPLMMVKNDIGEFLEWSPIFWIKVENKKAKLNSADITWAVRTRSKSKQSLIDINSAKEHKRIGADMPLIHFLELAKTNKQMPLYAIENWRDKKLLSFNEKENIFISIDTIQTINPVTYETQLKIVRNSLDTQDIKKMRFIQEWAWDNKRKKLLVNLVGAAPMRDVKNEAGEFLYMSPLFYQRFDD